MRFPFAAPLFTSLMAFGAAGALAQTGSIYTCTDAQGRHLTSDRMIPQCLDREQYELNPSGTIRRVIPPSLTADERARLEARQRAEAEARARAIEERRKEQAMLIRYPNEESHQRARTVALQQVNAVIEAVRQREAELDKQRADILAEMEFYQRDPSRAPEWLKLRQAAEPAADGVAAHLSGRPAARDCPHPPALRRRTGGAQAPVGRAGPGSALSGAAPDLQPSFFFSRSLTWPGLALPLLAFMT
jgi:hypothetical protein